MADLRNQIKTAKRLSSLLRTFSYFTWFVMLGVVTLNMVYMSNYWNMLSAYTLPIPNSLIFIMGVGMIFTIIGIQSLFIYILYKVKKSKEPLNKKNSGLERDIV
ncbi:MAG: hypothetical protein ACUVXA_01505 [Candidatus Jordarchaeum sp.]|uniref:hypothetical protein n=1 Tax=Candidatus Jordarchaeum sp. TaxID=2823881 RepID=UPI00404A86D0